MPSEHPRHKAEACQSHRCTQQSGHKGSEVRPVVSLLSQEKQPVFFCFHLPNKSRQSLRRLAAFPSGNEIAGRVEALLPCGDRLGQDSRRLAYPRREVGNPLLLTGIVFGQLLHVSRVILCRSLLAVSKD